MAAVFKLHLAGGRAHVRVPHTSQIQGKTEELKKEGKGTAQKGKAKMQEMSSSDKRGSSNM